MQERVYSLEEAAELMGVTPFAAFQIFSSVFIKEGENLYVSRLARNRCVGAVSRTCPFQPSTSRMKGYFGGLL